MLKKNQISFISWVINMYSFKKIDTSKKNSIKSKRILCVAEAFGFGPASKLIAFLKLNLFPGYELTFLGNSCAYELCKHEPFNRIINADPTDISPESTLMKEIKNHDIFISSMEFKAISHVNKSGLKIIIIDSLFWMWSKTPCKLEHIDLYLCQNFIHVNERCSLIKSNNLFTIFPLTLSKQKTLKNENKNKILLNFGGMDNPFAKKELLIVYAMCMFDIVQQICTKLKLELEVYGREWIIEILKPYYTNTVTTYGSLPINKFVDRLSEAYGIITSPGLEVLYESFTSKIPIYLLPPQNNSQAHQAELLQLENPELPGPQYPDLISSTQVTKGINPSNEICQILDSVDKLKKDDLALKKLKISIEKFLTMDNNELNKLTDSQFKFIKKMQNSANISNINNLRSIIEKKF